MDADWVSVTAGDLARLENPHKEKKKATIIALVDARLSGRAEETVWDLPQTCARSTYHEKWKKDAVFFDVLSKVYGAASRWEDEKALRALALAGERLALASPVAVGKAIERLNSTDESIILRAAFGILDRAGLGKDGGADNQGNPVEPEFVTQMIEKVYGGSDDGDSD